MVTFQADGFDDLSEKLSEYLKSLDNVTAILEVGAKELIKDVNKLPKPRSRISKSGYTHLLDSMQYQKKNKEVEVGWGKYYGIMVERGTRKTAAQPHLVPTYQKNREKYYKKMLEAGGLQ